MLNMLTVDPGCQHGDDKMHGLYVMKLVRSFCTSSSEKQGEFISL